MKRFRPVFLGGVALAAAVLSVRADEPAKIPFDLPADSAERSLKKFSAQSGVEVLFVTETAAKVRTNEVVGDYTPRGAIDLMLQGTGLMATEDQTTGAFRILPADDPNAQGAAPADKSVVPTANQSSGSKTSDRAVLLNPFEVQADSDNSYGALNSNSITSFNAALDHVPVTADILDQAFLNDVGATTVEGALSTYDAGAQFGGSGLGQVSVNQPGDHGSNPALSLRGSHIGGIQTNGLQLNAGNYGATSFGSTADYDLERIEIINGPQALLYDGAGPGGVVNIVQKEARIGEPTFGEFDYRIDEYGTKYATFDYGTSAGKVAARVSLIDASNESRRVDIGDELKGGYVQLAAELGNTVVSVSLSQSVDNRNYQLYQTLTSTGDPTFSKFNGDHLEYLLATNQAAGILNNQLNWNNSASFGGEQTSDHDVSEDAIVKAESTWTHWLSTQLVFGAANYDDMQAGAGTINLYSPGASSNPLPGNWTMGMPQSGDPMEADWRPHVTHAIRFTALVTNDLFGGRAKSQTSFDADATSTNASLPAYEYYQADGNWNVLFNPAVSANNGRTLLPSLAWTVNNGPALYSLFNPDVDRVTYNGVNYVQFIKNLSQGRSYDYQKGYAVMNYTQWLDGKLDTLVGARANETNGPNGSPFDKPEFSVGADYHVRPWLAPYFTVSDLWNAVDDQLPNGQYGPSSHSVSEEAGLKFNTEGGRISGSISAYHLLVTGEEYPGQSIAADISPTGLNGQIPSGTGGNLQVNALTYGATAAMTAAPTKNWRMRLSAAWTGGKFEQGVSFGQLYNDQFHQDTSGDVTYGDGTIVYVPATYNSKQLTVPAGTAGAVPLTVALLSTPGSQYYASPQPVTGAILSTSNGGLVLLNGASTTHGTILTGATGLPISAYQLNPALSGVAPVGVVVGALPGEQTYGYPAYAVNFTNVYEFSSGWFKGFKIGGTVSAQWRDLLSYYYPSTTQRSPSNETQFWAPMLARFDLIIGYTHKFRRVTWSTQLNVANIFNHYHVLLYPNANTGYSVLTSITANFDQQPRTYVWTNKIKF